MSRLGRWEPQKFPNKKTPPLLKGKLGLPSEASSVFNICCAVTPARMVWFPRVTEKLSKILRSRLRSKYGALPCATTVADPSNILTLGIRPYGSGLARLLVSEERIEASFAGPESAPLIVPCE